MKQGEQLKRKVSILLLLLAIFALCYPFYGFIFNFTSPQTAYAGNNYFVSTTGSDATGNGSEGNPWATLDYALTGSRVSRGDTVNVLEGTYDAFNGAHVYIQPVFGGSGDTPVTIQAYPAGAVVNLNIPSNASTAMFYLKSASWTKMHFKNVNFTNTHSVASVMLTWLYGHEITFENTYIDMNNTARCIATMSNDTSNAKVTILRSTIKNVGTTYAIIRNSRTDQATPIVDIQDSLIIGSSYATPIELKASNLTLKNNTFATSAYVVSMQETGSTMTAKNNIFYDHTGSAHSPFWFPTSGTAMADFVSNPSRWDVKNNIWYSSSAAPTNLVNQSSSNIQYLLLDDPSNHWLNPSFTNQAGGDYSIAANSMICGFGSIADLPSGGDINSAAWAGADIGAYKCPSASHPSVNLLDKVAFAGDSIMRANGVTPSVYSTFNDITGKSYVTPANAAIAGANMQTIFAYLDYTITNDSPDVIFLSVGINNLVTADTNVADQQYADYLLRMMQKIENWGARPIWLGLGTANGYSGLDDTHIDAVNALINSSCTGYGWSCGTYLSQLKLNANWQSASPSGYYDTPGNVHPNSDGHIVIGRTAEYLYYSHEEIGANSVNVGAGAKVYKDGKFRSLGTTSGLTADLSIYPANGSFTIGDYTHWLDITNISWSNVDDHHKSWTETSAVSGLSNTIHTVGNLESNKYYYVRVDDVVGQNIVGDNCISGICKSDDRGRITFTYTGNYSSHIFDVIEYAIVTLPATGAK